MSTDQDNDDVIFWTEDYFLKWEDFLGEPDFQKIAKAKSDVGLVTKHELEYLKTKSKVKFRFKNFTVKAIFIKSKSWKKNDMKEDRISYVLNHEQGHFDISQKYVNVAYERLHHIFDSKSYSVEGKTQEEIVNNARHLSDKMAKVVMDKVISEYNAIQMKYENETKYGTNDEKQKEYDEQFKKLRK